MKIKSKAVYKTSDDKERLAEFLSRIITGNDVPDVPYKKRKDNPMSWTLDGGNNWWLHFDEEDFSIFHVIYRYNKGNEAEEKLWSWLSYRMSNVQKIN